MTSSTTDAGKWLPAGAVGSPHGLDGSFHVTRPRAELLSLGAKVFIDGAERVIERRAGTDRRPILRLDGCHDRNGAEAIRGSRILVPRELAPPLEAEEWWAEDLEGCAVRDGERAVGVVRRLLVLPSCEVLEVGRPDGASDLLVPLVRDAVRSVDIERQEIDVDLRFLGEAQVRDRVRLMRDRVRLMRDRVRLMRDREGLMGDRRERG